MLCCALPQTRTRIIFRQVVTSVLSLPLGHNERPNMCRRNKQSHIASLLDSGKTDHLDKRHNGRQLLRSRRFIFCLSLEKFRSLINE